MKSFPLKHKELPEEIMSEYMIRGFVTEKLRIHDVSFDLENRVAAALVDVDTDFVNSYEGNKDNSYHWSVITAYRAVSQLATGYICTWRKNTKKEIGEIMQISSSMTTRAHIKQIQNVPVSVEIIKLYPKVRGCRSLGELNFDVANKAFYGNIRFAVDLEQ